MPYGIPRSEKERIERHKTIYGDESEPPEERLGVGPKSEDASQVIYDLLPALPLEFGALTLPLPRGMMRKIAGTKMGAKEAEK